MKVIALSGWKGSGKDTLALHLINNSGFTRVSFADPLKDMAATEYNIPRADIDNRDKKESPILTMPVKPQDPFSLMVSQFLIKEFRSKNNEIPRSYIGINGEFMGSFEDGSVKTVYWTPRALAILKGSTNRAVSSDYWVKTAVNHIKNTAGPVVVTDLRFKSEMSQLKEAFGKDVVFVRINRFSESVSTDPSERDLDNTKFDFIVDNTKTLEYAVEQIEHILSVIKGDV